MGNTELLWALAARSDGVVTRRAALEVGVGEKAFDWAVKRGQLHRLRRGIYTLAGNWAMATPHDRHRLLVVAAQHAVPASVAVADSAAVLLGLPVPVIPNPPRLTLARGPAPSGGRGSEGGTRGRRALLDPDEVMQCDGLWVTVPVRTVVDCGRHPSPSWALAVADAACARWQLGSRELELAAGRNPRAPGHPVAVWLAEHARPEPESPLESLARAGAGPRGGPVPDGRPSPSGPVAGGLPPRQIAGLPTSSSCLTSHVQSL